MRFIILSCFLICSAFIQAQRISIDDSSVLRIEKMLASDDMQGRKVFTPGIEKAASFIEDEFKNSGLQPYPGNNGFRQSFYMIQADSTEITGDINGISLDKKNLVVFSPASSISITQEDQYQKIFVKTAPEFNAAIFKYLDADQHVIVIVDTSLSKKFKRLSAYHMAQFGGSGNRIFVLTTEVPRSYRIEIMQATQKRNLTNIMGILPGKSKAKEYIVFSAHYDHLGIGKPNAAGDSIYNGANDDASGTTAVIALAKYFGQLHNNERTLIFAAFTAEEMGEFGSAYFSKKLNPDDIVAMLNIEMIGTESKWGARSVYLTGFEQSSLGTILQKNLDKSLFSIYPDPYPEQQLFLRSDNASLAKLGVPAHTISSSKMDTEPYYHTPGDGIETLDLNNMTAIIRAIARSAEPLISGAETPTRVKISN